MSSFIVDAKRTFYSRNLARKQVSEHEKAIHMDSNNLLIFLCYYFLITFADFFYNLKQNTVLDTNKKHYFLRLIYKAVSIKVKEVY